jgi:hypothetical protein
VALGAENVDVLAVTPPRSLAFWVNGGLGAGSDARRAVLAGDGAVPTSVRGDDILLLVSELVTNAVRHAGVEAGWAGAGGAQAVARRVRVEVAHPGKGFQHKPVAPALGANGGWGLVLVTGSRTAGGSPVPRMTPACGSSFGRKRELAAARMSRERQRAQAARWAGRH